LYVAYATSANQIHNARIILRAQQNDGFKTNLFQSIAEVLCVNSGQFIEMLAPIKIASEVTLKFHAIPTANGQVTTIARGWVE
jgi:hypothetical protein